MPYLGNLPAERFTSFDKQTITGNGGTSYTLDHPVGNEQEIEVFVNNVRQEPSVAYTVAGTALTMTGNVESSDDFYVVFQGKATQTATHPETFDLKAVNGTFSGDVTAVDGTFSGDLTATNFDFTDGGSAFTSGDANAYARFTHTNGSAQVGLFRAGGSAGGMYIGGDSSGLRIFNSGFSEKMRVLQGGGITFNGDTAAANALDDYEEGDFSPYLYGSTTAGTWTANSQGKGYYVKIGKAVMTWLNLNGTLSGAAGTMYIGGLPFTTAAYNASEGGNSIYSSGSVQYWAGVASQVIGPLTPPSNTYAYFHTYVTNSTAGTTPAVANTTHNLHCSIHYFTD